MVNERLVHENYALRQLAEQQQERLALLNSADGTGGAPSTSADVGRIRYSVGIALTCSSKS